MNHNRQIILASLYSKLARTNQNNRPNLPSPSNTFLPVFRGCTITGIEMQHNLIVSENAVSIVWWCTIAIAHATHENYTVVSPRVVSACFSFASQLVPNWYRNDYRCFFEVVSHAGTASERAPPAAKTRSGENISTPSPSPSPSPTLHQPSPRSYVWGTK